MSYILQKSDQKKLIIILGVLLLINTAFFSLPVLPGSLSKITEQAPEQNPSDVMIFYSPNEVCEFLKAIGPDGRQAFQIMHLTIDLSFPSLSFTACFSSY